MRTLFPHLDHRPAHRTSPLAAGLAVTAAALFALASIETLASQALTAQEPVAPAPAKRGACAPAPAPIAVDPRRAERSDGEPHIARERQPFCTTFHCY